MINEFFNLVLPSEGYYSILGLKKDHQPKQYLVGSLEKVRKLKVTLLEDNRDIYFACAKFKTDTNRKAENAQWFKALRLDLDCGEGKPYPTQNDAIQALKAFANKILLPRPVLVNSGNGIHVYWPLAETIERVDWGILSRALHRAVEFNGLLVDTSVTTDAARVLRIPGTKNFKNGVVKDVKLICMAQTTSAEDWKELLHEYIDNTQPVEQPKVPFIDPVTKALMGNKVSNFREIIRKSLLGKGCQQLKQVLVNQDTVDYNLWRAGLSIAINCEDGEKAIHKISDRHPDYSPNETITKAQDALDKPYKCETFATINSSGCEGCALRGKITSPIQIGSHVVEAETDAVEITDKETGEQVEIIIPKYPFPYLRGQNGGVYVKGATLPDGTKEDDALVYPYDFYVLSRLIDPDIGECVKLRLHMPMEGVKEFYLPYTTLVTIDKLKSFLAIQGMVLTEKKVLNIMTYITKCIDELQRLEKAEVARQQFGWCDNDTKFIVGNREISKDGVKYSPSSAATAEVAAHYGRKGDIHEWRKLANFYAIPGNEVRAFCLFSGFGSPLLKFTDLDGGIIHLTNNESGVGKTTVQYLINSIWGHPKEAILGQKDTYLSRMQRTLVLGNLPLCVDELTNMVDSEASDMLYNISHGRVRNRLQSQVNAERKNNLRWSLIGVTSGNRSVHDQLFNLKEFPEGELMRLLEFNVSKVDNMTKEETDIGFSPMYRNYGIAGEIFMRYVVGNLGEVNALRASMQKKIDADCGFTQKERYWSAMITCSMVGGVIAKKLELHDIDTNSVYRWLVHEVRRMKIDVKPNVSGPTGHLGQFLNENINNSLVVNERLDLRSGLLSAPTKEPRGELVIRYEPDTYMLYVVAKAFRNWCSDNQISFKGTKEAMFLNGILVGEVKKNMAKGTALKAPGVWALQIDSRKVDDFPMSELISEGLP